MKTLLKNHEDKFRSSAILSCVLTLQFFLLAWGAWRHSPTYDEVAHLPAGIRHWEESDYRLFRVNPPLVRMIASLPVVLVGAETDWTKLDGLAPLSKKRVDFDVGRDFITANGARSFWLYTIARWTCIPFALLGSVICWKWAYQLYGSKAALVALLIWAADPLVVGHGQLITPDVPAASLGVLAFYSFSGWLRKGEWHGVWLTGIALGVAELAKTTWVIAVPLMIAIALLWPNGRWLSWRSRVGQLVAIMLTAWLVLLAGYEFDGVLRPLGEFRFTSRSLAGVIPDGEVDGNRFRGTFMEAALVPLPEQYVMGVDIQKGNFESTTQSYLRGELRDHGWWYYYAYALGVKATLGSLVLFCLVSAFRLSRSSRWPRRDEWVLLLPMMLVFLLVSSQTGINKHMRYLLPAYPFAVIWLSQVIAQWKNSVAKCAVVVSVSSAIVSSLWASPHSMSYFNELVGGPRQGHKHLINSNCDWGQDLFFLRDKLERLGWSEIELVYWGRYNAELSGIDFRLPPESVVREEGAEVPLSVVAPRPGRYAASVSQIHGYRFPAPNGVGGKENTKGGYEYFKSFEPVDTAGYSMLLYELNEDSVRGVRKAHGLDRIDRISFEVVRNMDFSTRRPVALGAMHRSFAAVVAFQTGEIELYGVPKFKSRWVSPNAGVSCSSLDVSSDDSMIASGYADGSIRVWDASGSADEIELRWEERASQVPVVSLSFSMDGKKLATGDEDGVVTVFDTTSGKAITFTRLSLSATSVDWINSDEIAIGTGDWRKGQRGKICIYSFESGSIDTLVDSRNFIYDLATKQNGRVIGRTTNGSLGIWGDDRRVEHRLLGQGARKLSLSKDEQWLVSGDDAGRVRAWATKVGVMVFEGRVSSSALLDVVFCQRRDSNDPGWVLTIDRSGQVKLLKVIASRGEG